MTRPFEGVRVIDFTQVYAGPYATMHLALLGADVIKIERPKDGDDLRWNTDVPNLLEHGMAPMFMAPNVGKRGITLDLKHPRAREVVERLVRDADVVVENFRPGVMDRLGMGYKALSAINPRLIYCAISGFGQTGPEAMTPAYDGKIQATSGIMSVTGHPEMGPTRAGFAVADAAAGLMGSFGLATALYQRTRTGRGQFVDVSMLDTAMSLMCPGFAEQTTAGITLGQTGNMAISRRPTADLFKCKGGFVLLAVNNEGQFRSLCAFIGKPELLDDPRFTDWPARSANVAALREILEAAFVEHDAETLERAMAEKSIPAARIWTMDEAVNHPQLKHRDVLVTVPSSPGLPDPLTFVGTGFTLDHGKPGTDLPPPRLGEHTDTVLAEAGYTPEEVATLRASGAV